MVVCTVLDADGNVKVAKRSFWRKLFGLEPKKMIFVHHNTITVTGDKLLADLLSDTPTQNKVDNAHGYIKCGTGWTGNTPKSNTGVNTPTGTAQELASTYPKTRYAFSGQETSAIVDYRAVFAAGTLNANGINEVALMNGNGNDASCLAYAQLTPSLNLTANDSLQIDWSITIQGS